MFAILLVAIAFLVLFAALVLLALRGIKAVQKGDGDWATLMSRMPWEDRPFDPRAIAGLPAAAQRYFGAVITPGSTLRTVAVVATRERNGGRVVECFTIVAAPHGFIRRAYRRRFGLSSSRAEGMLDGRAVSENSLARIVPMPGQPPARAVLFEIMAIRALLWTPAALMGPQARWQSLEGGNVAVTLAGRDQACRLELTLDGDGRACRVAGPTLAASASGFREFSGFSLPDRVVIEDAQGGAQEIELVWVRFVGPWAGSSHS